MPPDSPFSPLSARCNSRIFALLGVALPEGAESHFIVGHHFGLGEHLYFSARQATRRRARCATPDQDGWALEKYDEVVLISFSAPHLIADVTVVRPGTPPSRTSQAPIRLEVRRLTSDAGCLWTWSEVPHFFCGDFLMFKKVLWKACTQKCLDLSRLWMCSWPLLTWTLVFPMSNECCRSQRCVSRSPQVWHSTFFVSLLQF